MIYIYMINTIVKDGLDHSRLLFIENYGNYANDYSLVKADGNQVSSNMIWVLIIAIFTISIFGIGKSQISDDNKKNNTILEYTDKILLGIIILSVASFGISGIYLLGYWIMYKIQYFQWFADLPNEAKIAIGAMSATKSLMNR
jgi:hypothetical protein